MEHYYSFANDISLGRKRANCVLLDIHFMLSAVYWHLSHVAILIFIVGIEGS